MNLKTVILIFFLFSPFENVFSYDAVTTHAGITEQTINFYESKFFNLLSSPEKEQIIKGSIDEDYPVVRVLNHFYDPIRNIGINNFRTAKDWATNNYTDNFYTWQKAVRLYSEGDKEKSLIYLGHIMHLIQDMTVPDHTRNDAHVGEGISGLFTGESSYEVWSQKNKYRGTLNNLNTPFFNQKPVIFEKLEDYFNYLANYSNRNFFGDDSIQNSVYYYAEPKILEKDKKYAYGIDNFDNIKYPILNIKILNNEKEQLYLDIDKNPLVVSNYFSRLSKQAVLAGAGVIDLFFREGEKARIEYLKEKARLAEAEIQKAIELNKSLSSSGYVGLTLFGLKSIVQNNIINPISNTASSLGGGFISGSKIVSTGILSAGSFLAFSSNVVASQAIADAKLVINNTISSIKSLAFSDSINNVANISQISTMIPNNAFAKVANNKSILGDIKVEVLETFIVKEEVVDNVALQMASLSNALAILDEISANLTKQPIKEVQKVYASAPYSPGFGGGETQPGTLASKSDGDKGVDKVGTSDENGEINEENSTSTTSTVLSETETSISPTTESDGENNSENASSTPASDIGGEEEDDDSNATSTSETIDDEEEEENIADTSAPNISLDIVECSNSLSSDSCLLFSKSLNISWSSDAIDFSHFEINNNGNISETTGTSTIISSILDNSTFTFSVLAVDASGNKSEKIEKVVTISFSPVIINEVAWNGTAGHSEDEWIELYNRTDKIINLDNWILYSKTDLSPFLKLKGEILPHKYYLIERKNDGETNELTQSPVKNIEANLWASFGSGILNSGENILLTYSSTTVDEIPLINNWGGGTLRSLERYDPEIASVSSNWIANNGEIMNGVSVTSAAVFGTPNARNSASYSINKNLAITKDLILKKISSPYYILKNTFVDIREGINLSIEPGVVIKFGDGAGISATGNLMSIGTENDPIVFTSFRDDKYGGDTNSDGICDKLNLESLATCPYPGSYYGIWFNNKSLSSLVSNSIFRYGGIAGGISSRRGLISADSTAVNIDKSLFEYSATNGIILRDSSSIITGSRFENNSLDASYSAVNVTRGSPKIENNTFSNNSNGISSDSSGADYLDNDFSQNKFKAIYTINKIGGKILGNESLGGTEFDSNNKINVSGNISGLNATTTLMSNPMAYFVDGPVSVVADSTLYIGEGVKMMNSFNGSASRLVVSGKLIVDGTVANPVIFSSNLENSAKESWQGITLNIGSFSDIKGAIFKDAKNSITYIKSPINLEDVEFRNNLLGVLVSSNPSPVEKAINVYFGDTNTATTSPAGLW